MYRKNDVDVKRPGDNIITLLFVVVPKPLMTLVHMHYQQVGLDNHYKNFGMIQKTQFKPYPQAKRFFCLGGDLTGYVGSEVSGCKGLHGGQVLGEAIRGVELSQFFFSFGFYYSEHLFQEAKKSILLHTSVGCHILKLISFF